MGEKLHLGDIITNRAQAVALVLEQEAAPRSFVIVKARYPSLLRERGFGLNIVPHVVPILGREAAPLRLLS